MGGVVGIAGGIILTPLFISMGMICNTYDQGVFVWNWQGERCFVIIETDDIALSAKTRASFIILQKE